MALCYKDRTFCDSDCTISDCWRYFGPEQREDARRWADRCRLPNVPIMWYDYSGQCPDYTPPDRQEKKA